MSKTAIMIPTRLKSTRLPNKPLALIDNKPLIQHVWEHAVQVHPQEDIYIASGDQEIIDVAEKFGAQCVLTDPSLPSGTDRISVALDEVDPDGLKYDTVINFQGDGLNVDPKLNLQLIDVLKETKTDIATVGLKLTQEDLIQSPNYVKIALSLEENKPYGKALYFSRSIIPYNRDNVEAYNFVYWHIGIYAYTRTALKKFVSLKEGVLERIEKLEQLRALENNMSISALIVPSVKLIEEAPADINTEEELKQATVFFK